MKKLLSTYRKACGRSFPAELLAELPVSGLVPLDGQPLEGSLLIGSEQASRRPRLIQGDIDEFIRSRAQGYFLMGYWGHGVNSYAFYYSRIDSWSKIFFRLPYGGVYGDAERDGFLIGQFLDIYSFFEKKLRAANKKFIAIDSMGAGYYRLTNNDGTISELKESLFRNQDIGTKFGV